MIEIPVNSYYTIEFVASKDDMPYDLDQVPEFSIYDAETATLIRSGEANVVVDSTGQYTVDITPSDTAFDRILEVNWTYTLDGDEVVSQEIINVDTPYATVSEIIEELGLGVESSDEQYTPYSKLRSAERLARMIINNYTGQSFGKRLGSQTVNGTDKRILELTERMFSITRIDQNDLTVWDSENDINSLGFNPVLTDTGFGIRISRDENETINYYSVGMTVAPASVFRINDTFKVYGMIGWKYVPLDVKQATFLLINDLLQNDSLWNMKYIEKIKTGQIDVTLRGAAIRGTGNLWVDNLLSNYKNFNAMVI